MLKMPHVRNAARALFTMGLLVTAASAAIEAGKTDPAKLTKNPDTWFTSDAGQKIMANLVSWQNADGGWWKEYDLDMPRPEKLPDGGKMIGGGGSWLLCSTIDNNATFSEMRALARAIRLAPQPTYRPAFDRGLAYLLKAQYPNGGFPQRFPLQDNYGRMITFNDDAMTNVLRLLEDIAGGKGDFEFVSPEQKAKAQAAFDKGIDCILKCQIVAHGKLTVWCQQHDPVTFAPTGARAFELPSQCSTESATIAMLLMDVPNPSPEVKKAIAAAVAWFEEKKITGKKWAFVTGPTAEGGKDRTITDDPSAPPLWPRFTDIDTGKPFFVSRDGIKRSAVTEIARERRTGYAWYNTSPQKVIEAYAKWKAKNGG